MRVLFVSHRYPPDALAGVERCTQAIAGELTRRGDDVAVLARRPDAAVHQPYIAREQSAEPFPVYRLVGGAAPRDVSLSLAHHHRLEQLFELVLLEFAPEVVHFQHLIDLSPRMIEIAKRHACATVLALHDFFFACPRIILQQTTGQQCGGPRGGRECARVCFAADADAARPLELRSSYLRRLLAEPQYLLCPSQHVADFFRRWGGADVSERVRVVPNGIWVSDGAKADAPDARPTPRQRGGLNVAFLGSVTPHKGVHVLLQAAAMALRDMPARPIHIDLHGPADPKYAALIRDQAAEIAGLSVTHHGSYEPDRVPDLLRDVDCLVAPSQWPEIFLLVTREAMACGVPAVVTRLGALPEAVKDGENGLLFDHDKPEQLADILKRLADDEPLLRRLRRGARASQPMNIADHSAVVRTIYKEALSGLSASMRGADDASKVELDLLFETLLDSGADPARNLIPLSIRSDMPAEVLA